jgi:hypothetical protein
MARWSNFAIWRGRLPHWRADGVTYYVTFRSRRDLTLNECELLMRSLLKAEGRQGEILIVCVLPGQTELLLRVQDGEDGVPFEFGDLIEKAKLRAGKAIVKKSGERFPPFYAESYDRIVRDDVELEERWQAILESPVQAELCEEPEEYCALWVSNAPE